MGNDGYLTYLYCKNEVVFGASKMTKKELDDIRQNILALMDNLNRIYFENEKEYDIKKEVILRYSVRILGDVSKEIDRFMQKYGSEN